MRSVPTDRSAFGLDGQVFQAAPRENSAVRIVHLIVNFAELLGVRRETVSVFHQEFARSQHTKPRTFLVAELGLNLIDRNRQLTVTADLSGH